MTVKEERHPGPVVQHSHKPVEVHEAIPVCEPEVLSCFYFFFEAM